MRGRVLLWVSLGLNIALAVMLVRFSPEVTDRNATLAVTPPPIDAPKSYKTNVVVRRQNFTWDEIESADFLAGNQAGVPELEQRREGLHAPE